MKDTSSLNTKGVEQLLIIPDETKSESRKRYLGAVTVTLWLRLRSAAGRRSKPCEIISVILGSTPFFSFKGDFELSALQ
jgi:hypothetical protein